MELKSPVAPLPLQAGLVVLAALLIAFTLRIVELTPRVDESFFFGEEDPQLQEDRKIKKIFPDQEQIIINIEGKISSPQYLSRVRRLTQRVLEIPQVLTAKSLTHGPKNFDDALTSEFWGRTLISEDRKSSNIFIILDKASPPQSIPLIEKAAAESATDDFQPLIAGIPYMIELIRRRLLYDVKVFSLSAVALFGVFIFLTFRSLSILVGALTASAAACAVTLLLGHYLGMEIGILTANLITIVFVLTIPHLIYFTYNWKLYGEAPEGSVWEAWRATLPGSFWSMATTLLGFLSLILVQAKPLRQLGASGSIGTVSALLMAYLVYPPFLLGLDARKKGKGINVEQEASLRLLSRASPWITGLFFVLCLSLGTGIFRLDTDPSLLSYFPKGIRRGLEYVDHSGGSSLMDIVLRDSRGAKLNTNEAYERLWQLQRSLERNSEIGTVISLPVLMAEAKSFPLSFLFSWKTILKKMEEPKYERVAQSFISYDHLYGHFILRMREIGRAGPRHEIIGRIEKTIRKHDFTPVLIGGMYPLQAQLAQLVTRSLIEGLAEIVLLLGVIGLIVSRSLWVASTMTLGMTLIPIGLLGLIGLLKAPLDAISAPAATLTLGMGIDDTMIHMVERWRSLLRTERDEITAWEQARAQLWRPIVVSMFVVCFGFSIFILSQFPPTRRFGLWVVIGTLLVPPSALFFLPSVASFRPRVRRHLGRLKSSIFRACFFKRS